MLDFNPVVRDRLRAHPRRRSRSVPTRDRPARADQRQLSPRRGRRDGRLEHGRAAERADHRGSRRHGDQACSAAANIRSRRKSALGPGEFALVLRPIPESKRARRRNSEASLGELLGGSTSQILVSDLGVLDRAGLRRRGALALGPPLRVRQLVEHLAQLLAPRSADRAEIGVLIVDELVLVDREAVGAVADEIER